MVKGIQAFNACWIKLRSFYPTGRAQNLKIAQAMGRVIDHYGTVEEIEQTLPIDLKGLFRELVHAYFHGYRVNSTSPVISSQAVISDRIQTIKAPQTSQTNGETEQAVISGKPVLADKGFRNRRRVHDSRLLHPNEAETLIIETPFAG